MKLVLMYADTSRLESVKTSLRELHAPGYTVLPVEEGAGATGLHRGDRVHPGALSLVMVIDEDERAEALFDELARRRGEHGDAVSKLFLMPVLRQA